VKKKKFQKKILLITFTIFLIAFCVRFINLETVKNNPYFDYPIMDENYHDVWAQEIAEGNVFVNVPFYRAPAYPYFLGFIYSIFGHGYYIPRLIGIIIGSLSCVLIYLVGKELFKPNIGILAALLACFYSMFLYFDSMLLTTNLEVFFCLFGILWLLFWLKTKKNLHLVLFGILWGLASITRPNFLIFVPIFVFYLLFSFNKEPLKKRLQFVIIFFIGVVPALVAVILINIFAGKDTVWVAWNGGINFYLGNNQYANGWSATSPELDATWWGGYRDAIIIAEQKMGQKLLPSQISNYWFKQGFDYIVSKPLDWAGLMLKKIYLMFNSFEISNNQNIQSFILFSPLMRIPLLNYGLIISLAIWGIVCSDKKRVVIIIFLFMLSYALSIVLFFVNARYRMPLVPFLLIFAAVAVLWIIQKFVEKKYKHAVLSIFIIGGLFVFANSDFYGTHSVDYNRIQVSLGNRFSESGEYNRAVQEFKKALDYNPQNTDALNALGTTYIMMGKPYDAMRVFRESIHINNNADALCKLGVIYFQFGWMDSAQSCFNDAMIMGSTNPEGYYYIGVYYAFAKQPNLAIKNLETSLQYYPDPKYINSIHYNLGRLYLEINKIEEAKKHLLQAGEDYKDVSKILKSLH